MNLPALLFATSVVLSGCIATRSGPAPTGVWPVTDSAPVSISLAIQGGVTSNGAPAEIPRVFAGWREETLKAYRESGCFSTVTEGLAPSDLHATIEIRDDETANQAAHIVSSLTLFLIPAVVDSKMTVNTELRDQGDRVVGQFSESEVRHLWIQLFLLPALPFALAHPTMRMKNIVYDLNRRTLTSAAGRGLCSKDVRPQGVYLDPVPYPAFLKWLRG
ncbi:MAG: hypothetical protein ACRDQZ_10145 [Mycobacteriales bacterium]